MDPTRPEREGGLQQTHGVKHTLTSLEGPGNVLLSGGNDRRVQSCHRQGQKATELTWAETEEDIQDLLRRNR